MTTIERIAIANRVLKLDEARTRLGAADAPSEDTKLHVYRAFIVTVLELVDAAGFDVVERPSIAPHGVDPGAAPMMTHLLCVACWNATRLPDTPPSKVVDTHSGAACCNCGEPTSSRIFVRRAIAPCMGKHA